MKAKIILFILIAVLSQTMRGQENDSLFARLQGISNQGVEFFNVDGIEITSQKVNAEFSAKNAAKNFKQLKIKEKELTTSDSLLEFRNFYVFKSEENPVGLLYNMSYYFIESVDDKLIALTFTSINKTDKEFERNFIKLVRDNGIPQSIYNSTEIDSINFAGRKIQLGSACRWMGINNVQCPHYGQMNWSVHKNLEDASATVNNQFLSVTSRKGGKVVSDTTVNVIFEGTKTTARKIIYDFTGARSLLLSMAGSKRLTIYLIAAPVRQYFVSCVMSFWGSDQINSSGLAPLLEEVMKLE